LQMNRETEQSTPPPTAKPAINWKGWIGIALFIAFIFGVNFEKYSPEGHARSAAAWRGAIHEIGQEACDAHDWSQTPGKCEQLAKEARQRAEKRFENYQK